MDQRRMLSVVIPAHNEAGYIEACLRGLFAQRFAEPVAREIIVAANGCSDETVGIAQGLAGQADAAGWSLTVLDLPEGGKPHALNNADDVATGSLRVYLDADVICSPDLMAQIVGALGQPGAIYASGTLVVAPAKSWVTRRFAHLWSRLPFMTMDVPGAGLFAVNAEARARWDQFPRIISDDGYVRLLFKPTERVKVPASYLWPMVEGFGALVRVRRRQDAGIREIGEKFPGLPENEGKAPVRLVDHLRLFLGAPLSYLVYVSVILCVRFSGRASGQGWDRGR